MKTYLIPQSNREIERFLQENKIYYLFKTHNEEPQIIFELFDEKKEMIDKLKTFTNGNVHAVDILPPHFVGAFLRELSAREEKRRPSYRDRGDNEDRYQRGRDEDRYQRGRDDGRYRNSIMGGNRGERQDGRRYDRYERTDRPERSERSERSDRGYQRRSSS